MSAFAGSAQPPPQMTVEGLTQSEAQRRLRECGPNSLPGPPRRPLWSRTAEQLRDPMILLLLVAATVTAVLEDYSNTVIIALVVTFNTTVGVAQQVRADKAMVSLRRMTAPVAQVRRDGVSRQVPTEEIVPGDIVDLASGDIVPADGILLDSTQAQANQALLTGESLPVDLTRGDEVIAGTSMTRGRGTVRITRTGAESGIGRISGLLARSAPRATPLQRRLGQVSRMLVVVVGSLVAVVFLSGIVQGRPATEMVVVGLSLAVAAVPESLPAVVTVALALGAARMARREAVVRSLPAVETLGSVTVVATDKTGTITEGTMLAARVWTPGATYAASGAGYRPAGEITRIGGGTGPEDPRLRRLLRDVVLCNDADLVEQPEGRWTVVGDPLEGALVALAAKGGVLAGPTRNAWPRAGEQPFDHATMRMVTEHTCSDGRRLTVLKGAPEAVLSALTEPARSAHEEEMTAVAAELADQGYRVIAVADDEAEPGAGLRAVGLVAVGDPPREHAPDVVRRLRDAGIRVILVTGDHAGTASAIARRVGIATPTDRAVQGRDLASGEVADLDGVAVIARVRPEQKVAVVDSLLRVGHVVAMLGDGVNDAPALRRADIGVAAGFGGSEVAKQASDLVLMNEDLSTVVAAVEEGRRIFANIRAFLTYALSGGLAEVAVMLLGPLIGLTLALLPGQILWINLLTHGLTGVAFGGEPAAPGEMRRPPRPTSESILPPRSRVMLAVSTLTLTLTALAAGALTTGADPERRTAVFLALGLGQLGVALALRARTRRRLRDRRLELAVTCAAALQVAGCLVPGLRELLDTTLPSADELVMVALLALVPGAVVRVLTAWSAPFQVARRS